MFINNEVHAAVCCVAASSMDSHQAVFVVYVFVAVGGA